MLVGGIVTVVPYGNATSFPELHYNARIGDEHVQFKESPWNGNRSTLAVTGPDGTVTEYTLNEDHKPRGLGLEKIVVKNARDGATAPTDPQAQVKAYFEKVLAENTKNYR